MNDFFAEMEEENHVWAAMDDRDLVEYLDLLINQNCNMIQIPQGLHDRLALWFVNNGATYDDGVLLKWKDKLLVSKDFGD